MKLSWQAHLELIASRKGIEGASKKAFMETFLPCDPSQGKHPPKILKDSDREYDRYRKAINRAFKSLGFTDKESLKCVNKVLPWLLEEYDSPCISKWEALPENDGRKLDELLRRLNYLEQRHQVEKSIVGSAIRKIFLVQADDYFTQRWLTKRLSIEVPNHSLSKGFNITAKPRWNRNLNIFWDALSRYANNAEKPEEIIEILGSRCQTQPLIMAIHEIDEIEPQTLEALMSVFWGKLLQHIGRQSWCNQHADCVLFLTSNSKHNHYIDASYGIHLLPWDDVTVDHMQQWLKASEVKKLLKKCTGESAEDAYLDLLPHGKQPDESLGSLEEVLKQICKAFDLNGLVDLDPYWDLAS